MKIYRLNSNINEEMDYEDVKNYLQEHFGFTLDNTLNPRTISKQCEMLEIMIEACFTVEETEDEDIWEDDTKERQLEYREVQGF